MTRNVKRWRDASMALRRAAASMMEAQAGFRRLKAHRQLPALRWTLADRHARRLESAGGGQGCLCQRPDVTSNLPDGDFLLWAKNGNGYDFRTKVLLGLGGELPARPAAIAGRLMSMPGLTRFS
jgi:hypothetical protein